MNSLNNENELLISGESIQWIYEKYKENKFLVNRRYQRKLVWTVEEKQAFIDSIVKRYPIPLILLAEVKYENELKYEIIDGMQRLNAIISFIEGEFAVDDEYFNLETMATSKLLKDNNQLIQRNPYLSQEFCSKVTNYKMPLSIYRFEREETVDEVFRRINSNGKHLSRQELRQAGALGAFPELIRKLSSKVRGDVSPGDTLYLNGMKKISITNRDLPYGIKVDDIFWVKNGILRKSDVRDSKDEEVIADIVAYMISKTKPISSGKNLDQLYGLVSSKKREQIDEEVLKRTDRNIIIDFEKVLDEVKKILSIANTKFNKLVLDSKNNNNDKAPKYFQVIFLALHYLIIEKNMRVQNYNNLIESLNNIGSKTINITKGGTWAASERKNNVAAVSGIIEPHFVKVEGDDPATTSWVTSLENILDQSSIEQNLYDFKQGFHKLNDSGDFDQNAFSKVIKTLTSMANLGKNNSGYILVGIADTLKDSNRIKKLYEIEPRKYKDIYISGVDGEASKFYKSLDEYRTKIKQNIEREPISEEFKSLILRKFKIVKYYEKHIVIFEVTSLKEPVSYNGEYFERNGSELCKISHELYMNLFQRFIS